MGKKKGETEAQSLKKKMGHEGKSKRMRKEGQL
jgi:hypothetical protein